MARFSCRLVALVVVSLLVRVESAIEREPNTSSADDSRTCSDQVQECGRVISTPNEQKTWIPFQLSAEESSWISFKRLTEKYIAWHEEALNSDISCKRKKVLVFTPNAGLGDSIGALTSAFMYAMRSGRLFLINWQPFPWSVTFKDLPFSYDYLKVSKMTSSSTGEPLICPEEDEKMSYLSGHITSQHPLVKEAEERDIVTEYNLLADFFLKPSDKVQAIIDGITQGPFKNDDKGDVLIHRVSIVMRTGIGEYNQFLSVGDEKNFVTCFKNYALKFKRDAEKDWKINRKNKKRIKFAVFVTSDNAEAKQNAIISLENIKNDLDIEVVTLEDSAIHVMHMTAEESRLKRIRTKLRKTVAEFFIIGISETRFLTHGSLFGRTAAETGGGSEVNNHFISDSHCDGKREKHSYLSCHEPKYPAICGLE